MQKCYKKWIEINEWLPNCLRNCRLNNFSKLQQNSPNYLSNAATSNSNSTANSATSSDVSDSLMVFLIYILSESNMYIFIYT